MTTATATDYTAPLIGGRHHFLLRRLHSLTGIIFGGYIVVHLLVNATLIQGTVGGINVYNVNVQKIHELPFLWAVEWAFIFVPILYHTVYGIWIIATGQPNVGSYPFGKNWFYLLQRISAILIVFFVLFHVLGMKGLLGSALTFDADNPTVSTVKHINAHWSVAYILYPLGILASCYHLANGFWTGAITWGLTISAAAQRRWGVACIGLFFFSLACGLIAVGAAIYQGAMLVHR